MRIFLIGPSFFEKTGIYKWLSANGLQLLFPPLEIKASHLRFGEFEKGRLLQPNLTQLFFYFAFLQYEKREILRFLLFQEKLSSPLQAFWKELPTPLLSVVFCSRRSDLLEMFFCLYISLVFAKQMLESWRFNGWLQLRLGSILKRQNLGFPTSALNSE
ncbi:Hypothetical predicted protein [Podarcis lilfordi]|uniref:Uncharacterized protein n=1 Tax=Podarcis lilfordi TaxID=74358 RepID=A0AA35LMZ6_9SAUR|nr:Hypothetical predicted protein [Podarcis lilfordi]